VDDELALLKARMLLGKTAYPPTLKDSAVDAELEQLRSKLKESTSSLEKKSQTMPLKTL